MNNLKQSRELTWNLQLQSEDEEALGFAAFDMERNRLFFASSSNFIYTTHLPSSQDVIAWRSTSLTLATERIGLEPGDTITSFDYLMEKEALIVGTSKGLLLLHNVEDNVTEIVGKVEGGVKCISPSPDGDLLGVITGFGQILVMTPDWDLLYEMALEELPEGGDVSEPTSSTNYSFECPMSWRGDGKYFATLSMVHNAASLDKKIKVWERDSGAPHSVSESKSFMGSVLEWMPNGAKIASVCDRMAEKKCPSIVFFERNGLERSSFSINEAMNSTVEILKWNCHSDLLAAVVRCERYDSLKIWSFSNNHWYLKQEIRCPTQDGVRFMWDPTKPLQLICWTLGGQITIFSFVWLTAVTENSISLVIDGSEIQVTPLSIALIPPPMFLFNLRFPSPVRDIAFWSKGLKNRLAASLSNCCLCVVELPQLDFWEELEGKEFNVEVSYSESSIGSSLHLVWLDSHVLLGVSHFGFRHSDCLPEACSGKNGLLPGYYIQEIELVCSEDHVPGLVTCSGWHAKISSQISLEEQVIGIVPNPSRRFSAFVQFDGGKISEYASKLCVTGGVSGIIQVHDNLGFLSSCPRMCVASIVDSGSSKSLIFGLDDSSRLHVNGRILSNNCSSFSFYSNFSDHVVTHVILATKQDLLFIVDIGDVLLEPLNAKYDNFVPVVKKRNEEKRNCISIWEKGAKIVGVLHGDEAAVILQTSRGNLECIYPRKLVLSSIVNALIQGRFKDALLMVRRHRIDFNVIVDHCGWKVFLQLAPEFVRQVNNLSHITEFVCSMKDENIMETLYKNYISLPCLKGADIEAKKFEGSDAINKISAVLMAIRKALEEQVVASPARELCILTTLARTDPPALEEALKRIKVIREMELSDSDDPKKVSFPSAEEALKHLLWLSDGEAVYEAALGLYDLNLAAIVALNSQRDPKEFLPFLQELERMPTLLMQYSIDLKLQKYENALRHVVMAGDAYYADCMNLMKNNPELFLLGLQLISDPSKRRQVLEAWGDHLSNKKCFEDAAATYLCCTSLEKALKAYRACGNWRGVLTVAGIIRLGKEEVMQLAHELCEELQAVGKPGEAAKIALEYCGDANAGINLLVSARDWEEALRVALMHRRDDLVSEVKNASLECANVLIGEYEEGLEKVGKYLTRYLAVRQRRLLLAAKLQSDERSVNEVNDDTASESSSNFSGMSAYSRGTRKGSAASISLSTSSKARDMKRQRNKGKIRAGSPGEEMALVEHLKGMSLTTGAKHELRSLLVSLLTLGKEDIARKLQRIGENFQLSQMAAVKLADDVVCSDIIDEQAHSLNCYIQKVGKELQDSDTFSWRSRVLLSP
ncbi:elongator complex protein 1-like isoform X1 [Rhododendron vialii]|uniref:elongator complex protein 1-like isoform X1 n=2 Tax=Rhododendron vialii TaxID=182163 RepID=UPI00265EF324|nr:elongator complex protein 1-like isoform X1 [Rhododendron vialii]